jgi:hypothetical protein
MKTVGKVAWLFLFVLMIPAVGALAEEVTTVRAEGKALFGDYTTPAEAKAVALNNARRAALTEALTGKKGDAVHVYTGETVQALLGYVTRGVIVEETVTESRWDPAEDGSMFWHVGIQAKVKRLDGGSKADFRIEKAAVVPAGKDAMEENPVFHAGTELQIRVKVDAKAYLHILAVDRNGLVFTVYPNRYAGKVPLKKGKELVYPPEELRVRGIRIRALPPKGLEETAESVVVVATKKRAKFLKKDMEHPALSDLLTELSAMDGAGWTAKTIGYRIEGGH